jgi:hypothetical protein
MIGTLALEMIATTSVMCAMRIALANSANNLPLLASENRLLDTTKSISLRRSAVNIIDNGAVWPHVQFRNSSHSP